MNAEPLIAEKTKVHPCFTPAGQPHPQVGRLHLPVSPLCNIFCRFCNRGIDDGNGVGPGLTAGILPLSKVKDTVKRALTICPDIRVVGVAGPGDALASDHALDALRLVGENWPELFRCLSTNGLALPDKAEVLAASGITHLTVTVNAVNPEIQARLCGGIVLDGQRLKGVEAAAILIEHQLAGIEKAVKLGITVKINTVVIPGLNDRHTGEIAMAMAERGAFRMNLLPLLPAHAMVNERKPSCEEMGSAKALAAEHIELSAHCARCRADACGVPGVSEFSGWLYGGGPGGTPFSHG